MKIKLTKEQYLAFQILNDARLAAENRLVDANNARRGFLDALKPGAVDARYMHENETLELLFSNGNELIGR